MRKLLFFLCLGAVGYFGHLYWQDPEGFVKRMSSRKEEAEEPAPRRPKELTAKQPVKDSAAELAFFVRMKMEDLLAPLSNEFHEAPVAAVSELKLGVSTQFAKEADPQRKIRLQMAMQLAGMVEQAVAQREDHAKRRKAVEYHPDPPGSRASRVAQADIDSKIKRAEFFTGSIDKKWNDLAAQYRAGFQRLLIVLSP